MNAAINNKFPSFGIFRQLMVMLALMVGLVSCAEPKQQADMILHNGVVFTSVEGDRQYSVVVVNGDRISAVGDHELLKTYASEHMIDLRGRFLMPGFNDSHTHIQAQPGRFIDLTKIKSISDLKAAVVAKAQELGPDEWITGYGWSEDVFPEGRRPYRSDLDEAAPNNPVLLTRAGGHSAVVNSLALAIGQLDENSPDPEDGVLEKGDDGLLNGIIRERQDILYEHIPAGTAEELADSLEGNLRASFALGITSLTDASVTPDEFHKQWQPVYARSGASLPRATVQIHPDMRAVGIDEALERLQAFGRKTGEGNDRLKVGPVKVFVDGGFTGPAAWTLEGYRSDASYSGKSAVGMDELYQLIKYGHENGFQFGIHAIGDRAIVEAVAVLTRVLDESPQSDHRHYLNHFTVMPPAETMDTMAAYDIGITQQPNFTYTLEGRYVAHLDGARLEHNNPVGTPIRRGVRVALSSDILPIGPLVGIYAAVTRKGMSGRVFGCADECISVEQALRAYTWGGAYQHRNEGDKGTLVPGMLADMVVLDRNLLEIDPDTIMDTQVEMTILGGRIVHER